MKLSKSPYKIAIILALVLFIPLLIMITNHFLSRHQTSVALREVEQTTFIRWFGIEIACNAYGEELADKAREIGIDPVVVLGSLCATDVIPYAMTWQENGLVGLGILDQGQVEAIIYSDRFSDYPENIQEDVMLLLTGGFPTLSEAEFLAERFLSGVSRIDFIFRDLGVDINIQNSWNRLVRGTRDEAK